MTTLELRPAGAPLDRMIKEEQLHRAEKLARLGSFDWDPVSGELSWSDGHFRLWGLEPGRVTPTYALFRQGVHPEDIEGLEAKLQAAMREIGRAHV